MARSPLPPFAAESQPPPNAMPAPQPCVETAGESGGKRKTKERRVAWFRSAEVSWEKARRRVPSCHTPGYVAGLSALLTGFPPFIIAGSLVLLLGGTGAFGTVSPTSCNDGSLYMATEGGDGRGRDG